ncbi:MAG: hypothetical protein ACOXZK_03875 [Bacteroidales bacterium]
MVSTKKKDSANQLIRMGCYLSFGHHLLDESSKAFATIASIPVKNIFLETDESEHNIEDIYKAAAKARNMDIEKLSEKIFRKLQHCFWQIVSYCIELNTKKTFPCVEKSFLHRLLSVLFFGFGYIFSH